VAAVMLAEDIAIRAINIAVVAPMSFLALRSQQVVFIAAVRTQEVALSQEAVPLPEAAAHMSPTAAADAVDNK
jgi:hypothetical protein